MIRSAARLAAQLECDWHAVAVVMPHLRAGRVRALGVSGAHRSPALPDTPTMQEAGVKGYESYTWYGMLAPKATPRAVIARLNADSARAIKHPDVVERLTRAELLAQTMDANDRHAASGTKWAHHEQAL